MNAFRLRPDMPLDRQYLRLTAVHRLIRKGAIKSKSRAIELIAQKMPHKSDTDARAVVEVWLANQFKGMEIHD